MGLRRIFSACWSSFRAVWDAMVAVVSGQPIWGFEVREACGCGCSGDMGLLFGVSCRKVGMRDQLEGRIRLA